MARRRRAAAGAPGRPAGKRVKSRRRPTDNSRDVMLGGIGLAEIRRLIQLVQRTGIGELEVRASGRAVRISATAGPTAGETAPHGAGIAAAPGWPERPIGAPAGGSAVAAGGAAETAVAITSPMVGTFYRAPAPDADPYVEVGDRVELGQTVCIVEAMKLMNEIESEVRGRVVKILVENAQPVEFGQRLFLVEPV